MPEDRSPKMLLLQCYYSHKKNLARRGTRKNRRLANFHAVLESENFKADEGIGLGRRARPKNKLLVFKNVASVATNLYPIKEGPISLLMIMT
jgi:hypothetical protein